MKKKLIFIFSLLLLSIFAGTQTVKAADVTNRVSTVAVKTLTPLYARQSDGSFKKTTGRQIAAMTSWYSDQLTYNDNYTYYRVSTNEWVQSGDNVLDQLHNEKLTAQVDNYQQIDAKVIKINNTSADVYDDYGVKTGTSVPANSLWKVDMSYMVGVPGVAGFDVFQRIGNNAWISLSNASVTERL